MANNFTREIVSGDELLDKKISGAEKVDQVASAAYGAAGGNVMIERNFGAPIISRDGVSNLNQLHVKDPVENMTIQAIVQSSQRTNQNAGDGTTATAILASRLVADGINRVKNGENRMKVSRDILETSRKVSDYVFKKKYDATEKDLRNVAKISVGDPALGELVADVFESFGDGDGGVIVSTHDSDATTWENEEGFYFRKGFANDQLLTNPAIRESRMTREVPILVISKFLKSEKDITDILENFAQWAIDVRGMSAPIEMLLVADVQDGALGVLSLNNGNIIRPTIVAPLEGGARRSAFLEDLASYVGAKVIDNAFTENSCGFAKEVAVSPFSTNIIGGYGSPDDVRSRIEAIELQMSNSLDYDYLSQRRSRLMGKVANIYVGGETEIVRQELKLRVDDAVNAVRSAKESGIVCGEATTLLRAGEMLSAPVYKSLTRSLIDNAGLDANSIISDILNANYGYGTNLREGSKSLINLRSHGIVDPVEVVQETVKNAAAVASIIITTSVGLFYEEREVKRD